MFTNIISACFLFSLSSPVFAVDFPVSRLDRLHRVLLPKKELKRLLPCDPSLISHWVNEEGFGKEVRIQYAGYALTRTDVGSPDGWLNVSSGDKTLCRIELSLDPDLYISAKTKLLILSGYSGSNNNLEVFSIDNECRYLGYLDYDPADAEVRNILDSHDGSRTCKQ